MLYQLSYARVVVTILAAVAEIVPADDEPRARLSYTRSTENKTGGTNGNDHTFGR